MTFGKYIRAAGQTAKLLGLGLALLAAPASAQEAQQVAPREAPALPADAPVPVQAAASAAEATTGGETEAATTAAPVERMKPTEGKGMPTPDAIGLQKQYSQLGEYGAWIHNAVLMPIITVITLFVLLLLLIVMARYNRRRNPVASKTSHNTMIEIVWTLVPALILAAIAFPSIDLLAKQFKPAPEDALTIKVTGNQWYWTYSYPDNGDFEYTSYMLNLPGYPEINSGVRTVGESDSDGPAQLEVDNRLVVPAGEKIRMQITASDVIHSFAVPSLWFKIDAVPGRINEKVMQIDEPGVYYGQCSELCGPKHAYMPIAIEALPRAEFEAWVRSKGGTTKREAAAAAAAEANAAAEAGAAAPDEEATAADAPEGEAADAPSDAAAPAA